MSSSKTDSVTSIEKSIGIVSILYGLAVGIIRLVPDAQLKSVIAEVLVNDTTALLYILTFVVGGIFILVGHKIKKNWMIADGLFLTAIIRMFQVITVWLTSGFLQPTWFATALLAYICSRLWLSRQIKPDDYGS